MSNLKKNVYPLLNLAIPLILAGLLRAIPGFFMTGFLAHMSQNALAVGSLIGAMLNAFLVIFFGTLSSINILVAYQHGTNNQQQISLIVRDGLWLVLILTVPIFLLLWYSSPLLIYLGQKPELISLTESYLRAFCWGILPNLVYIVLTEFIMGIVRMRLFLVFSSLYAICYLFFCFVLMFGKFGLPSLGVAGAGWGATIGMWCTTLSMLTYLYIKKEYKPYLPSLFSKEKPFYFPEILKIGIPIGLIYCSELLFFLIIVLIIGSFSVSLLVANQIVMQYIGIQIPIILSLAQAITVYMSYLLGMGNVSAAKEVANTGLVISITFILMIACLCWFLPEALVSIDLNIKKPENQVIVHYTVQLLAVSAIFQIINTARVSLYATLRALKDTLFPALVSFICLWGIALPCGYLLMTRYKLGGVGLWLGLCFGLMPSIPTFYWRFKFKLKQCVS